MTDTYVAPRYQCDLIMKGGITSGVVYPPAVCELARDHRLRSVGGSSAGAIVAVTAAAAELGRHSSTGGFELLSSLPTRLAEVDGTSRTFLQRLFQAQGPTSEVFELFWLSRRTSGTQRVRAMVDRLAQRGDVDRRIDVIGALASMIAIAVTVVASATSQWWGVVAGTLLIALVAVVWFALRKVVRIASGTVALAKAVPNGVVGNMYGLCNGRSGDGSSDPALTEWMHSVIQALAGRDDPGLSEAQRRTPVTYGELRGAEVQLVTMTTDLTRGSPEEFPFRGGGWAFDEAEMRTLFPDLVVDHLLEKSVAPDDPELRNAMERAGLHALPAADDLPILIGARVSLSFPILLSAVPLHTPVFERNGANGWLARYTRCWLSDGGITSNLPVHLFDRALPRRPTYAINLSGGGDGLASCERVWRPLGARQGRQAPSGEIETAPQFLSAVFDTMQNWSDNSRIRAPGFRDRICTIRLGTGEGGMNLDMPPDTIARIAALGVLAGENLASMQRGVTGTCPIPGGVKPDQFVHQWDRHRFTRYRLFLSGTARFLSDAQTAFDESDYPGLARSAVEQPWFSYCSDWTAGGSKAIENDLRTMFGADLARMQRGAPAGAVLGFVPRSRNLGE